MATSSPQPYLADVQDPSKTLATFTLDDLAQFKREGVFDANDSVDYRGFYVGRDDVHGCLKYLLSRCNHSLKLNMFGYDDEELNAIIAQLVLDPHVYVQGTLDKSQAAGVHEKKILAAWGPEMRASFAVGQSATHQISHTKGGVLDGKIAWEGSTNWSASGEGTGIVLGADATQPSGFKAQNNTLLVHVNPVECETFALRLDEEHATVLQQQQAASKPA